MKAGTRMRSYSEFKIFYGEASSLRDDQKD